MNAIDTDDVTMKITLGRIAQIWLLTHLSGAAIMITGAAIFHKVDTEIMAAVCAVLAICSAPACVLLPSFLHALANVRRAAARVSLVILFMAVLEFLLVFILGGTEARFAEKIKYMLICSPYVVTGTAAVLIVMREIIFKEHFTNKR